jgi:hypothetical protein
MLTQAEINIERYYMVRILRMLAKQPPQIFIKSKFSLIKIISFQYKQKYLAKC